MVKNTYNEILEMIVSACKRNFADDVKDKENTIIECATQIYIAQMNMHRE